jgi:hypothetical protein
MNPSVLDTKGVLDQLWNGCTIRAHKSRKGYMRYELVTPEGNKRGRAHYSAVKALESRGKLAHEGDTFILIKRAVRGKTAPEDLKKHDYGMRACKGYKMLVHKKDVCNSCEKKAAEAQ